MSENVPAAITIRCSHREKAKRSRIRRIDHNALDGLWVTLGVHEELMDAAHLQSDICKELLKVLNATIGESDDTLLGAIAHIDHFTVIDVVGIADDFLQQSDALADESRNVVERVQ